MDIQCNKCGNLVHTLNLDYLCIECVTHMLRLSEVENDMLRKRMIYLELQFTRFDGTITKENVKQEKYNANE